MRFTIRDLLWATVVVGMGFAWGVEYFCSNRRWLEFKAESLEGIFRDNGYVVEEKWPISVTVRRGRPEDGDWYEHTRGFGPEVDLGR